MIELRHLRAFVAVAEERHFTRAAARLHMTQPPLSAQIRQLEQRLGAKLFERAGGPVTLTPAGEALLQPAYAALGALDAGVEAVRAVASGDGRVRVAVSTTAPLGPALHAVAALARRAPATRAEVARADDPEDLLARGRADVVFLRTPVREPRRVQAVVVSEPRAVLAAVGHRLVHRGPVRLADLAREQVIEPADGALGVGWRTSGMEELLTRVAAGDAVAVVPQGLVREHGAGLAAVALADAPPSHIVVAAHDPPRAAAAAYLDAVRTPDAPLRLAA